MSVISPDKHDYQSHDGLQVAKDIALVMKTLWGGLVVVVVAAIWVAALAADVKTNTGHIEEAATAEQMALVLDGISDIKKSLDDADARQREIKSQVDKLEAEIDNIKKRTE